MSPEDWEGLSSVIDSKALMRRCLNNLQFAERILSLFEGTCAEELTDLDRALETGDMEAVRKIAHRLQGACANAGAVDLQTCASKLRNAANEPKSGEVAARLEDLHREWQRFGAALAGHRSASAPVSA
jgi:HPt (histidine-containing phosphotransfer) domain-containing protein